MAIKKEREEKIWRCMSADVLFTFAHFTSCAMYAHSDDERIDIVVTDARGDRGHLAKLQLVLLRVAKCYFFTQG